MKNSYLNYTIFFLFLISTCTSTFGQITFEKGYFIDNSGQKTDCLIKNIDWKNNPTSFQYKTTTLGGISTRNILSIKEFRVDKGFKYIRANVNINRSSNKVSELDGSRDVNFDKEQLFLKELVFGSANLYHYEDGNLNRFFYSINNEEPLQLVYKRYKKENIHVAENNEFRQQILNLLICDDVVDSRIKNLSYDEKSLKKIFDDYNSCNDPSNYIVTASTNKIKLNFKIRPRLNNTSYEVKSTGAQAFNANFGAQNSVSVGTEIEAILPFNKNKWSIIIEPTYQKYSNETTSQTTTNFNSVTYNAEVKYSSIELPIGIRHYIFLSKSVKVFLNASILADLPFNSSLTYPNINIIKPRIEFGLNISPALGFGIDISNKYSIEARYLGKREVFANVTDDDLSSEFGGFSLILGYSLF
ncbi:outer membrane beta-barrel protein [uncultured Maribacter sp.]|uniref:outer membrane beta-barrel protein n=1 Tax=uncultured Maribacter sp. TaxID=431308 RepID=UPI0030EBCBF7|tara:strand:- start:48439 stop:49683 length:1245 start_codon:yes stop_codon:yes gene_type:complete